LLQACANTGDLIAINMVLKEMQEEKIPLGLIAQNMHLNCFACAARNFPQHRKQIIADATSLYKEMKSSVGLDAVSHNAYLRVFTESMFIKTAESTLKELQENAQFKPDVHTYALLMRMYARAHRYADMKSLLGRMRADGMKPDKTLAILIANAFAGGAQMQSAMEVLKQLHADTGLQPKQEEVREMIKQSRVFGLQRDVELLCSTENKYVQGRSNKGLIAKEKEERRASAVGSKYPSPPSEVASEFSVPSASAAAAVSASRRASVKSAEA
jgi:pentatricopeptide repeat protein